MVRTKPVGKTVCNCLPGLHVSVPFSYGLESRIVHSESKSPGVDFRTDPSRFVPSPSQVVLRDFGTRWYEETQEVTQRDCGGPGGIRTHDSRIKSVTAAVLTRHFCNHG